MKNDIQNSIFSRVKIPEKVLYYYGNDIGGQNFGGGSSLRIYRDYNQCLHGGRYEKHIKKELESQSQ